MFRLRPSLFIFLFALALLPSLSYTFECLSGDEFKSVVTVVSLPFRPTWDFTEVDYFDTSKGKYESRLRSMPADLIPPDPVCYELSGLNRLKFKNYFYVNQENIERVMPELIDFLEIILNFDEKGDGKQWFVKSDRLSDYLMFGLDGKLKIYDPFPLLTYDEWYYDSKLDQKHAFAETIRLVIKEHKPLEKIVKKLEKFTLDDTIEQARGILKELRVQFPSRKADFPPMFNIFLHEKLDGSDFFKPTATNSPDTFNCFFYDDIGCYLNIHGVNITVGSMRGLTALVFCESHNVCYDWRTVASPTKSKARFTLLLQQYSDKGLVPQLETKTEYFLTQMFNLVKVTFNVVTKPRLIREFMKKDYLKTYDCKKFEKEPIVCVSHSGTARVFPIDGSERLKFPQGLEPKLVNLCEKNDFCGKNGFQLKVKPGAQLPSNAVVEQKSQPEIQEQAVKIVV